MSFDHIVCAFMTRGRLSSYSFKGGRRSIFETEGIRGIHPRHQKVKICGMDAFKTIVRIRLWSVCSQNPPEALPILDTS